METLLLGYASLTNTSLKLLACVPLKSELRLFSCGDIVCFQWWQFLLGFFVLFFLLPFVFVLYFGSKELYDSRISILHFMTACCLPLPVLVYWGFRRTRSIRSFRVDRNCSASHCTRSFGCVSIRFPCQPDCPVCNVCSWLGLASVAKN